MGQYWYLVNLNKREFINPHGLNSGMKLCEQLANHPSTGSALVILCAAMPAARGGGDFDLDRNTTPGPMPDDYQAIAKETIGRWAGNRIALIGDYAKKTDLPAEYAADLIYPLCGMTDRDFKEVIAHCKDQMNDPQNESWIPDLKDHITRLTAEFKNRGPYTDITDKVRRVIAHELGGTFKKMYPEDPDCEIYDYDPVKR
jgi:hypothetical protein